MKNWIPNPWWRALLAVGLLGSLAGPAAAQTLPWEVTVAEIEAGRLRNLAERLARQNLLYQLHLGDVRKSDMLETAAQVDRILESLEEGSPSYSIPGPWTNALREQVGKVDAVWGPLRTMAVASPYDYLNVSRQFVSRETSRGDPLLVRYFDNRASDLIEESEKLLAAYHDECLKKGLDVLCPTARTTGYTAMLIERATKEAVYIVAGLDAKENRKRLQATLEAYAAQQRANDANPFFAAALDPNRGASAKAALELFLSLRADWDAMQREFSILAAGDESNFDLRQLLVVQKRLVEKVERMTAALLRYAAITYGS